MNSLLYTRGKYAPPMSKDIAVGHINRMSANDAGIFYPKCLCHYLAYGIWCQKLVGKVELLPMNLVFSADSCVVLAKSRHWS
jgi:hypothetical protein